MRFVAEHSAWIIFGVLIAMAIIARLANKQKFAEKIADGAILSLSTFLGVVFGLQQAVFVKENEDRDKLLAMLRGVEVELNGHGRLYRRQNGGGSSGLSKTPKSSQDGPGYPSDLISWGVVSDE